MAGTAPGVWIETSDARDMIRADAIVVVRLDGGRLTAQLRGEANPTVTLIDEVAGAALPEDLHRRLVRTLAELADSGSPQLVRVARDRQGWHWVSEAL